MRSNTRVLGGVATRTACKDGDDYEVDQKCNMYKANKILLDIDATCSMLKCAVSIDCVSVSELGLKSWKRGSAGDSFNV
jgi:hypothetical protein